MAFGEVREKGFPPSIPAVVKIVRKNLGQLYLSSEEAQKHQEIDSLIISKVLVQCFKLSKRF